MKNSLYQIIVRSAPLTLSHHSNAVNLIDEIGVGVLVERLDDIIYPDLLNQVEKNVGVIYKAVERCLPALCYTAYRSKVKNVFGLKSNKCFIYNILIQQINILIVYGKLRISATINGGDIFINTEHFGTGLNSM